MTGERNRPGDVELVADAARLLPPAEGFYIEDEFVLALISTVLDYQMNSKAVVRAIEYYKANRWDEVRTIDDLDDVFARFPDDKDGNIALAQHLWAYNLWTRASQLRRLTEYFRSIGLVDLEQLRRWAARSTFESEFQGRVKGLGIAVYQWLVMRLGVDTIKPDVHVRRFAERAVGRNLSDQELIDLVSAAAASMGLKAYELDWRIWEAARAEA